MMQVKGIPTTICMQNGKTLKNLTPRGIERPVYNNIYLLTQQEAEYLFLSGEIKDNSEKLIEFKKVKDAGPLRTIKKGRAKVAEAPSEQDWQQAAVYKIQLSSDLSPLTSHLLKITYRGDCARLYANGKLVDDNFYYGRPFLFALL